MGAAAAAAAAAKEQRENPSCEPASVSHRVTDGRFYPRSQASGRRGPRCPPTPSCSPTPSTPPTPLSLSPPPLARSLAPALFPFDHIRAKTRGAIFRGGVVLFYLPASICGAQKSTEGFLTADVSSAALQSAGRGEGER